MTAPTKLRCAACKTKDCKTGKDCYDLSGDHRVFYEDETIRRIQVAAAAIEARHYCSETRLRETLLFAKELGVKKLGLAFCVGLSSEAKVIEEYFRSEFEVVSVCCKIGAMNKKDFGLEQIDPNNVEVTCNPAGQAELLNRAKTELNVLCGLCVGHDAIFNMRSNAPVTTLVTKDRVLAHNPAAAVYCQYVQKKL